jgi:2-oxoglutarate dehydrogenase complex dehydrogenase (E1) component-like enzyme
MSDLRSFHGPNAAYVLGQYEQFQRDPDSLDAEWRTFFEGFSDEEPRRAGLDAGGGYTG